MGLLQSHIEDDPEFAQLKAAIFGNDVIMHNILSFALWRNAPKYFNLDVPELSSAKARNIRLVSKHFNDLITTRFEERLHPLFSLQYHIAEDDDVNKRNKKFMDFMKHLEKGTLENPPPPFSLSIVVPGYFLKGEWRHLHSLFETQNQAISTLVKLDIYWFGRGDYNWPILHPEKKLPCLREFGFLEFKIQPEQQKMDDFIKAVMKATVTLKKINYRARVISANPDECVCTFPRTVRQLKIAFHPIWTCVKKPTAPLFLPNLSELEITLESVLTEDFPLDFEEMRNDIGLKLQRSMPKLTKLIIHSDSAAELNRWCDPFQRKGWPGITSLTLEGTGPIPRALMEKVNGAFAMVIDLELDIFYVNPIFAVNLEMELANFRSGMRYLFQEMRKLQRLQVTLMSELIDWDLVLLGIESNDLAKRLAEDPSLCDQFCRNDEQGQGDFPKLSSVRNLDQLKYLKISGRNTEWYSDLVFQIGFMKMPKLSHLILDFKGLHVSEIATKWQEEVPARTLQVGRD